jgi:acyl-CoA synthetase (NDP forming)
MLVHTSLTHGDTDEVARELRRLVARGITTPILAVFLGQPVAPAPMLDDRTGVVVPCYAFPEAAANALGAVATYAQWRDRPELEPEPLAGIDRGAARRIVTAALDAAPDGLWLDTDVAAELLRCYGVPVATTDRVTTAREAVETARRIGLPVAMKVADGSVVHRTDRGGVRLGLSSASDVRQALAAIRAACGPRAPVVVQPMEAPGVETAVGVVHDATIGPMVMVALGGVATDLLADRAFRLLPVSRADAREQITSLRAAPLLFGYRGTPPCDVTALEDVVLRVARLAEDLPEVAELDLNPVVVRPDGAVAVDVKVRLAPVAGPDPYQRRLSIVEHG